MQNPVITSNIKHLECLVRFQCQMAMETQHLKLDPELVSKAIKFLHQNNKYGFYFVCPNPEEPNSEKLPITSVLMLTKEHEKSWWIQSVYVQPKFRRQGNLTRMFQKAVQIAKQKSVKMIRLYAQKQNQRAKATYRKLGMELTGQIFYGFDMVLTKHRPNLNIQSKIDFTLREINHKENEQQSWQQFSNKHLNNFIKYIDNSPSVQNFGIFVLGKQSQVLAYCQYFYEFSEWRNSLIIYINQLRIAKDCQCSAEDLTKILMNHLLNSKDGLNIGVMRFLIREDELQKVKQIVTGGQVEVYHVMGIQI